MGSFAKLLETEIKDYFRSPVTAFWTFVYPFLIFLFLVFIFGNTTVNVSGVGEISYVPYLISGMLTINIISSSLFGFSIPIIEARSNGDLKMLSVFPIWKHSYIMAVITSRILIAIVFNLAFVILSAWGLSVKLGLGMLEWISLTFFVFLVSSAFTSLGFVFAAYCSRPATANALANILFFPMMFLSDSFMPMEFFPKILVYISEYSPLGASSAAFRNIILGDGVANFTFTVASLFILMVVSLVVSFKVFKWH